MVLLEQVPIPPATWNFDPEAALRVAKRKRDFVDARVDSLLGVHLEPDPGPQSPGAIEGVAARDGEEGIRVLKKEVLGMLA